MGAHVLACPQMRPQPPQVPPTLDPNLLGFWLSFGVILPLQSLHPLEIMASTDPSWRGAGGTGLQIRGEAAELGILVKPSQALSLLPPKAPFTLTEGPPGSFGRQERPQGLAGVSMHPLPLLWGPRPSPSHPNSSCLTSTEGERWPLSPWLNSGTR